MKTTTIRRSCQTIRLLAWCMLISHQALVYAEDAASEALKTSQFKISDDMRCGITEFRDGVLSIVNVEPFGENQDSLFHFNSKPVHFIAAAEYTGKTRNIPENKIKALLTYGSVKNWDAKSFRKNYASEMLFLENGREYWIPVQKQNILDFAEYGVKPGDQILLRIIYFGFESFKDGSNEFTFFLQAFKEKK